MPLRNGFATKIEASVQEGVKVKGKGRRRLLVLGGLLGAGAAIVAVNEDARHTIKTVPRSARVAATLFVNIWE